MAECGVRPTRVHCTHTHAAIIDARVYTYTHSRHQLSALEFKGESRLKTGYDRPVTLLPCVVRREHRAVMQISILSANFIFQHISNYADEPACTQHST